jgi:ABC-type nitrate/sulfonate/bicarbonate transport system permease component
MLATAKAAARETSTVRVIQLVCVVLFFGAWAVLTYSHFVNPLFLPAPTSVWKSLIRLAHSQTFWNNVGVTVATTAVAYTIASVFGIIVGFVVGRSPVLTKAYRPVLSGLFAIPITLFFPLFVVMFGIGPASKVAFGALYAFFPIALNTIAGFSGIDRLFLRAAKSQGASNWQMLRHIYLPGAWPVVISGLRIGFFITFASVLGGETLSSTAGMGHMIAHEADLLEGPTMYAYIVIVLAVTMLLNAGLAQVEKRAGRS